MGHRYGWALALFDDNVIVWLFWQFFWVRQVIQTVSATLNEESSTLLKRHQDLLKKTKSSAVNAFTTWWPEE
jgi:hypothetical protein